MKVDPIALLLLFCFMVSLVVAAPQPPLDEQCSGDSCQKCHSNYGCCWSAPKCGVNPTPDFPCPDSAPTTDSPQKRQSPFVSGATSDSASSFAKREVMTNVCSYLGGCTYGDWSSWSVCSSDCGSGVRTRVAEATGKDDYDNSACTAITQSQACETSCPVDCVLSEWSGYSKCSAPCTPGGSRTRTRTVTTEPANGGSACPGDLSQSEACNTAVECISCTYTEWNYSDCSNTCGAGVQTRSREVVQQGDMETCQDEEQVVSCEDSSGCVIDCVMSEWSQNGPCDAACFDQGAAVFRRAIITQAQNGGTPCGVLEETQACVRSCEIVHCELSEWSGWSNCPACGTGSTQRSREVVVEPNEYGDDCGKLTEIMSCDLPVCECEPWGSWSTCTEKPIITTTPSATPPKSPALPPPSSPPPGQPGATPTPSPDAPSSSPASSVAPPGSPSTPATGSSIPSAPPSKTPQTSGGNEGVKRQSNCEMGEQKRTRLVTDQAPDCSREESQDCYLGSCDEDCEVSPWSAWGACSKTCGGGVRNRSRTVISPASKGGASCGHLTEDDICNSHSCSVATTQSASPTPLPQICQQTDIVCDRSSTDGVTVSTGSVDGLVFTDDTISEDLVVEGSVEIQGQVLMTESVTVMGNFTTSDDSTIRKNSEPIHIAGCASFDGTLEIVITEGMDIEQNLTLFTFDCSFGAFTSISIVDEDPSRCYEEHVEVHNNGNALTGLFVPTQCADSVGDSGLTSMNLVFIVGGAAIFLLIVAAVLILAVPSLRERVFHWKVKGKRYEVEEAIYD